MSFIVIILVFCRRRFLLFTGKTPFFKRFWIHPETWLITHLETKIKKPRLRRSDDNHCVNWSNKFTVYSAWISIRIIGMTGWWCAWKSCQWLSFLFGIAFNTVTWYNYFWFCSTAIFYTGIVCSSFNIQYKSTGVGLLSSLDEIRLRRTIRSVFSCNIGTFRWKEGYNFCFGNLTTIIRGIY